MPLTNEQREWLATYLETDDLSSHARLLKWVDQLIYDAVRNEGYAIAALFCPYCAAGHKPERTDHGFQFHWRHMDILDAEKRSAYCSASPIWERGIKYEA